MIFAALVGVAAVLAFVLQDGINGCQDGARYTSGTAQPSPFHRRFHAWPASLLTVATWLSLFLLASTLGSWQRAALFASLPGVWMCVVMPTTVDLPAMALAFSSSLLCATHPVWAAVLSLLAGAIHERGPCFAALYAWSPIPLIGLLAVQWWAKKAPANHASPELADRLVGHTSLVDTWLAHKPHVDLLNDGGLVWAMRGVVPLAAWLGAPLHAWLALGLAFASRLIATDTARSLMWAAPILLRDLDPPAWAVALHVMTFRRVMR